MLITSYEARIVNNIIKRGIKMTDTIKLEAIGKNEDGNEETVLIDVRVEYGKTKGAKDNNTCFMFLAHDDLTDAGVYNLVISPETLKLKNPLMNNRFIVIGQGALGDVTVKNFDYGDKNISFVFGVDGQNMISNFVNQSENKIHFHGVDVTRLYANESGNDYITMKDGQLENLVIEGKDTQEDFLEIRGTDVDRVNRNGVGYKTTFNVYNAAVSVFDNKSPNLHLVLNDAEVPVFMHSVEEKDNSIHSKAELHGESNIIVNVINGNIEYTFDQFSRISTFGMLPEKPYKKTIIANDSHTGIGGYIFSR